MGKERSRPGGERRRAEGGRRARLALAAALLVALAAAALAVSPSRGAPEAAPPLDPAMPARVTRERRAILKHGLQLLAQGDVAFARAHFAGAMLPRPCKVLLADQGVPRDRRPAFRAAAGAAMSLWNAALPEHVRFEESDDPEACRVLLFFVPSVTSHSENLGRSRYVCGLTHVDAPHEGRTVPHRAMILVAIYQRGSRQVYSVPTITHVVAHELGHVIGIGESSDPKQIMGPNSPEPSVTLAPEDTAAARATLRYQQELIARCEAAQGMREPAE